MKQVNRFLLQLPSGSDFFGLTPAYQIKLYKQILNLAYYSRGSLTFTEVYNLPTTVRELYFAEITSYIEKENKAKEDAYKKAARKPRI